MDDEHIQPKDYSEGICPFQSTPEEKVSCNKECQLHRDGKGKFGCAFHDLAIIAWNLNSKSKRP